MDTFLDRFTHNKAYKQLYFDLRDKNIAAFGVQQNEKPLLLSGLDNFFLYVTADYVAAKEVVRALNCFNGGGYVFLPPREDVLLFRANESKQLVAERNSALYALSHGARGAVCSVESLLQPLVDKRLFDENTLFLGVGEEYGLTRLARELSRAGYERVDEIAVCGEYAVRGDIVDVFCSEGLVRINFFGDFVESIFTVSDNSNDKRLDSLTLLPMICAGHGDASLLEKVAALARKQKISPDAKSRLENILSELSLAADGNVDNAWLLPFMQQSALGDYLPQNAVVVWDEPKMLSERADFDFREQDARLAALMSSGEILPMHVASLLPREHIFDNFSPFRQLSLQTMTYSSAFFAPQQTAKFSSSAVALYKFDVSALAKDISNWKQFDYQVVLCCGNNLNVAELKRALSEGGIYVAEEGVLTENRADALLTNVTLAHGFVSHTNKIAFIGTRDLSSEQMPIVSKNKKQLFLAVEKGDYVVHDTHGIGLCEGVQKVKSASGLEKDYFVVLYKGGDRLYVPVENSNLLSRYSGGEKPVLSRLGGAEFAKVKTKVKKSIKAMSFDLVKLYAEREKPRGFTYKIDKYLEEEFSAAFPYDETEDQLKCIAEVNADLSKDKIMDRLLVGDVGYGKTEVAMRAAFAVISNKKQVAVLCPTTILAQQHFDTFEERMKYFGVKVACLNRFRSPKEIDDILTQLKSGEIDVVIGTHRLLSADVAFHDLGLLVLDEEQRFGVEHKEKLKLLKKGVDALTLSATPIPRTLHMALTGIRDISTITTPPKERMAVATFVVEDSAAMLADVITREINRGGQVFFVYNEVETMDLFYAKLSALVPKARIVCAHGQMPERALEDAVMGFLRKKADVLLCSTIIENGIDMPNANTLIVYDADKLGLAQLYQLRGRVGRSNRLAYAYFVYRQDKVLSSTAYKRLNSVLEYSDLGSGFKIALKDLEIRGAGNVLGSEQHGHMMKVGYEMYVRLLKETVAEIKGEKIVSTRACTVEMDVAAYAPSDYVPTVGMRMDFYQQLAACSDLSELDKLRTAMTQTYGAPPEETDNLFAITEVKILAEKCGVEKVDFKADKVLFYFCEKEKFLTSAVFDALAKYSALLTPSSTELCLVLSATGFMQKSRLLDLAISVLTTLNGEKTA